MIRSFSPEISIRASLFYFGTSLIYFGRVQSSLGNDITNFFSALIRDYSELVLISLELVFNSIVWAQKVQKTPEYYQILNKYVRKWVKVVESGGKLLTFVQGEQDNHYSL